MATGFSAVKSGIVMFVIQFIFAFYPEILLNKAAMIDPASATTGTVEYLSDYDGSIHLFPFLLLIARLVLALYLLASALAGYDRVELSRMQIGIRLIVAGLLIAKPEWIFGPAIMVSFALHFLGRSHKPVSQVGSVS